MLRAPVVRNRTFYSYDCDLESVGAPGRRRLLGFDVTVLNSGNADLVLGTPIGTGISVGECGAAYAVDLLRYELTDPRDGSIKAQGDARVAPGCAPYFDPTLSSRYSCDLLGLEQGFYETYSASLYGSIPFPFLDVTGIAPGDYVLRAVINPPAADATRRVSESDYSNNEFNIAYTLTADDPLAACPLGSSEFGPERECGWAPALIGSCESGAPVTLECPDCIGDPMLRVCDDADGCLAASALRNENDTVLEDGTYSSCPGASFFCPSSGVYAAFTAPNFPGDSFARCDVVESMTGPGGPGGAP